MTLQVTKTQVLLALAGVGAVYLVARLYFAAARGGASGREPIQRLRRALLIAAVTSMAALAVASLLVRVEAPFWLIVSFVAIGFGAGLVLAVAMFMTFWRGP